MTTTNKCDIWFYLTREICAKCKHEKDCEVCQQTLEWCINCDPYNGTSYDYATGYYLDNW